MNLAKGSSGRGEGKVPHHGPYPAFHLRHGCHPRQILRAEEGQRRSFCLFLCFLPFYYFFVSVFLLSRKWPRTTARTPLSRSGTVSIRRTSSGRTKTTAVFSGASVIIARTLSSSSSPPQALTFPATAALASSDPLSPEGARVASLSPVGVGVWAEGTCRHHRKVYIRHRFPRVSSRRS